MPGEAPTLLIDASLSLVNRTGAFYLAEELCANAAAQHRVIIRHWRLLGSELPSSLVRRLLARLMMREMRILSAAKQLRWPEPPGAAPKRLFLDPLYVLRSRLGPDDIVLCHDVGPVTHRDLYHSETSRLYSDAYAKIAHHKPGMVFVSRTSRRCFIEKYGKDFRFMEVIAPLVRDGSANGPSEPIAGVKGPFILTVGALERRKNHIAALRGYAESGLQQHGYSYVLCGSRGDSAHEVSELVERTPGARLLGYISDAQLRWLYREAAAFLLPSLLEGFGMPALEAARHGLIPVVSKQSALSEAVDDLGVQVDPQSSWDIARGLLEVTSLAPETVSQLKRRLIEHAMRSQPQHFAASWRELLAAEMTARRA